VLGRSGRHLGIAKVRAPRVPSSKPKRESLQKPGDTKPGDMTLPQLGMASENVCPSLLPAVFLLGVRGRLNFRIADRSLRTSSIPKISFVLT